MGAGFGGEAAGAAWQDHDAPSLQGGFAPVAQELTTDRLHIEGEVPQDLNGLYVRNGPNRQFAAPGRYHFFDGDGMLHALRFDRGRVEYRNRWIVTDGLTHERLAGQALWQGVKDPPRRDRPDQPLKNTANTDVTFWAGRLLATWYLGGTPYEVDPLDLSTRGPLDLSPGIDPRLHRLPISAHAKVDERTGEMMFFAYGKTPPYLWYGVLNGAGQLQALSEIALPGPRLPHDMAVTEHYSILHDLPLHYDREALAAGRHKLAFHADQPARFGVLPRHGGSADVRWFEAEPCYLYHTVNAWEEADGQGGTEIVMLGTPFRLPRSRAGAMDAAKVPLMFSTLENDYLLYEWRFNLRTGQTRERLLDDSVNSEFPSIRASRLGRHTRYSWHILMSRNRQPEAPRFSGLVRYDLHAGSCQTYQEGPDRWWSEAPFAARDRSVQAESAEDDGYLVGFVWNGETQQSQAYVMDARDLSRGPICRITLPQRVPHGFHATWVSAERLKAAA
jgi:carotenoid cleavage dioxygenase